MLEGDEKAKRIHAFVFLNISEFLFEEDLLYVCSLGSRLVSRIGLEIVFSIGYDALALVINNDKVQKHEAFHPPISINQPADN